LVGNSNTKLKHPHHAISSFPHSTLKSKYHTSTRYSLFLQNLVFCQLLNDRPQNDDKYAATRFDWKK